MTSPAPPNIIDCSKDSGIDVEEPALDTRGLIEIVNHLGIVHTGSPEKDIAS
jgi:hypothetical protein